MEEIKSGRSQFQKYKTFLHVLVYIFKILGKKNLNIIFKFFSSSQFKWAIGLRYILLKAMNCEIGDNVYIGSHVILKNIDKIKIGSNVSIHEFSYIDGYGGIKIGDDVSIAHNVSIISFEHLYGNKEISIKYQGLLKKEIIIENNVWIGCGSRILSGTIIRTGAIIGAGSIIKNQVLNNSIYSCERAKFIKGRVL